MGGDEKYSNLDGLFEQQKPRPSVAQAGFDAAWSLWFGLALLYINLGAAFFEFACFFLQTFLKSRLLVQTLLGGVSRTSCVIFMEQNLGPHIEQK